MIVGPILQKRKHEKVSYKQCAAEPDVGSRSSWSSSIFLPHHLTQHMDLSKQGPNQAPTLRRNLVTCSPLLIRGQSYLLAIQNLSHCFFFFLILFPTVPSRYHSLQTTVHIHWTLNISTSILMLDLPWYPLLAVACILIIFKSTTQVLPPHRVGPEASFNYTGPLI